MGYHPNVKTVRLELGGRFDFFGDETNLAVVVRPVLGGPEKVTHQGTRTVLVDGSPTRMEPTSSIDAPTPAGGTWEDENGAVVAAWAYDVTVTATAPGRSPVVWRGEVKVPESAGVVALDPATSGQVVASPQIPNGTPVDPRTGGSALPAAYGSAIGLSSPQDRKRHRPTFARIGSTPIFTEAQSALSTVYWPWVLRVDDVLDTPINKFYMWYSTDHDGGAGGIGLATAPAPEGPWTDYGQVYVDTHSGYSTETPSVIWDEDLGRFNMYYQQIGATGTIQQSTILATSPDGVTWTRVGVALAAPNQGEVMGSGEMTYFHPFRIGDKWYAYSLYGGGNYARFGISYSLDGVNWTVDRRQLGNSAEWFAHTGNRRVAFNHGSVVQWQGKLWWVGMLTGGDATGGAGETAKNARIGVAPISDDLRRITAPPRIILPPTEAWESQNYRALSIMSDGLDLYMYYQCDDKIGVATTKGAR